MESLDYLKLSIKILKNKLDEHNTILRDGLDEFYVKCAQVNKEHNRLFRDINNLKQQLKINVTLN